MKLETREVHDITFAVEYFENSEAGMDHGIFGVVVKTLPEAILILKTAQAVNRERDWIITCSVTTTVNGSEKP